MGGADRGGGPRGRRLMSERDEPVVTPLSMLNVLASQEVDITEDLRHLELYTMQGLLTILWHSRGDAKRAVIACGGAMGGLLGPADGLYHQLGAVLPGQGIDVL